ncbi:tetratricopeptide repeat protein [Candidatus Omnitrophota bacterium]
MSRKRLILLFFSLALLIVLSGCGAKKFFYKTKRPKLVPAKDLSQTYDTGLDLYRREKYHLAEDYFKVVISDFPESSLARVAMYYLASAYKEQEQYHDAIQTYQELIEEYKHGFWVNLAKRDLASIKSRSIVLPETY